MILMKNSFYENRETDLFRSIAEAIVEPVEGP